MHADVHAVLTEAGIAAKYFGDGASPDQRLLAILICEIRALRNLVASGEDHGRG
jgi:hypothetical protein